MASSRRRLPAQLLLGIALIAHPEGLATGTAKPSPLGIEGLHASLLMALPADDLALGITCEDIAPCPRSGQSRICPGQSLGALQDAGKNNVSQSAAIESLHGVLLAKALCAILLLARGLQLPATGFLRGEQV